MPIHVIIKRKLQVHQPEQLLPLLSELRNKAREQPGYIGGETPDFLVSAYTTPPGLRHVYAFSGVKPPFTTVTIDVDPDSVENAIDPQSRQDLAVAILGSDELDVNDVRVSSIE